MGSILARSLIYLFIRNRLCRLGPLINPGSQLNKLNQLTEDFVTKGEIRERAKKYTGHASYLPMSQSSANILKLTESHQKWINIK